MRKEPKTPEEIKLRTAQIEFVNRAMALATTLGALFLYFITR